MNAFASAFALMLTAALLAGCAGQGFDVNRAETVLPLKRAWVDGRTVDYITTDVSDAVMARAEGANYAPRLAGAVGITGKASILERVYMFPGRANQYFSVGASAYRRDQYRGSLQPPVAAGGSALAGACDGARAEVGRGTAGC